MIVLEEVIPNLLHKLIVCNKTVTVGMLNTTLDEVSKDIGDCPNVFKHVSPSGKITSLPLKTGMSFSFIASDTWKVCRRRRFNMEVYLLLIHVCDIVSSLVVLKSKLSFLDGLMSLSLYIQNLNSYNLLGSTTVPQTFN